MGRSSWRVLVGLFIVALFFSIGSFVLSKDISKREHVVLEEERRIQETILKDQSNKKDVYAQMHTAATVLDWQALLVPLEALLSSEEKILLRTTIGGKEFEARAQRRDTLLWYAARLLKINENDPIAKRYIDEARELHEENAEVIKNILERPNDCEWNSRLHYLKGLEFYRGLIFLKKSERAKKADLIDESLRNFKKVFICFPKDRDTEVAIELLYKRGTKGGGSSRPGRSGDKLKLMPSGEIGPGTAGSQRERGRH